MLNVVPGRYHMRFTNKRFYSVEGIDIEMDDDGINYVNIGEFFIEKKPVIKKHSEVRK